MPLAQPSRQLQRCCHVKELQAIVHVQLILVQEYTSLKI